MDPIVSNASPSVIRLTHHVSIEMIHSTVRAGGNVRAHSLAGAYKNLNVAVLQGIEFGCSPRLLNFINAD